jgi:tripartite-type tricarboxylate transporter receptor subunit TctC
MSRFAGNERLRRMLHGTLIPAAAAVSVLSGAALADPAEDFYRGRTVNFYIGNTVGGGYDLYGRFIARYLGSHIPGNPTIIPLNMPGAGGLNMAGWLFNKAPHDGTAIAIASQVLAIEQALESPGVQYDARKFNWIGRAAPVVELTYTWHTSPTKTLEDARRRETVMGGINPTSNTVTYLKLLNTFAGTKFKIISGYPGTSEMHLAMERGETEGATKTWEAFKADNSDWLRDKKVNILVQYALSKSPDMPDVPLMIDLGRTDADRQVLRFFASGNELGRAFMTAPDVPPERVAVLRKALADMVKDPAFLADAAKRQLEIGPMGGEEVGKIIEETLKVSPELIKAAKQARDG